MVALRWTIRLIMVPTLMKSVLLRWLQPVEFAKLLRTEAVMLNPPAPVLEGGRHVWQPGLAVAATLSRKLVLDACEEPA